MNRSILRIVGCRRFAPALQRTLVLAAFAVCSTAGCAVSSFSEAKPLKQVTLSSVAKPPTVAIMFPKGLPARYRSRTIASVAKWITLVETIDGPCPITGLCVQTTFATSGQEWKFYEDQEASRLSLGLIPIPDSFVAGSMEYLLWKDGALVATYRYDVAWKSFTWILVVPVFWLNFLLPDVNDVYVDTTEHFVYDARELLFAPADQPH